MPAGSPDPANPHQPPADPRGQIIWLLAHGLSEQRIGFLIPHERGELDSDTIRQWADGEAAEYDLSEFTAALAALVNIAAAALNHPRYQRDDLYETLTESILNAQGNSPAFYLWEGDYEEVAAMAYAINRRIGAIGAEHASPRLPASALTTAPERSAMRAYERDLDRNLRDLTQPHAIGVGGVIYVMLIWAGGLAATAWLINLIARLNQLVAELRGPADYLSLHPQLTPVAAVTIIALPAVYGFLVSRGTGAYFNNRAISQEDAANLKDDFSAVFPAAIVPIFGYAVAAYHSYGTGLMTATLKACVGRGDFPDVWVAVLPGIVVLMVAFEIGLWIGYKTIPAYTGREADQH